ncbi:MAG: ester cyclase [Parvularculaceae bacterium]|nr:ester cyclase [Parvularculaceae bacterium]
MNESNESAVRRLIEDGWNSRDPARLADYYDNPVSFRSPLVGQLETLEEVEQFAGRLFRAFPDASMKVTRLIEAGRNVFVHFAASGTNTGPLPDGGAATGRSMKFDGLAHVVVENGKVRQDWVYYDALSLFRQLGLAPQA